MGARWLRLAWTALVLVPQLIAVSKALELRGGRGLRAASDSAADLHAQLKEVRAQNKVLMAPVEQSLIEQYLEPDHTMLEWGSGFSTLWMSQVGWPSRIMRARARFLAYIFADLNISATYLSVPCDCLCMGFWRWSSAVRPTVLLGAFL